MITQQGQGYWVGEQEALDIVSFLERVVPHGQDEANRLLELATALDPRATDHDR
jgi:hypothetical protein